MPKKKKGLDIDRIVTITGDALNKTASAIGTHEPDKSLRMYKKLKPKHFEGLTDRFGAKVVDEYIKKHEFDILGVK